MQLTQCGIAKQNQNIRSLSGLPTHANPKDQWSGCTPDQKVFDLNAEKQGFNLLEIKVKESVTDFENVANLNRDMVSNVFKLKRNNDCDYQVCQLALTGLELCYFLFSVK